VNGAVQGGEFPETSHPPEPEHGPFPSSEWLVGILGAVIQPSADFAFFDGTDLLQCGTGGCQLICDDRLGLAMPLQRFS
jgi:hypothetical protein